jgi:transglutaminase-like putative cysteine protease
MTLTSTARLAPLRTCAFAAIAVMAAATTVWAARPEPPSPERTPKTAAGKYALLPTETKPFHATYTFEVETPDFLAREWVLFAAKAPNLAGRQTGMSTRLLPGGEPYRELSPRGRNILRALVPASNESLQHRVQVKVEYSGNLAGRRLVRREAGKSYLEIPVPSDAERSASLAESDIYDFKSADFRSWIAKNGLQRGRTEIDVDYARRVYLKLEQQVSYEYLKKMDRRASHVCKAGRSDCGGMSIAFVAAMRSAGIPAKIVAGRWARSSEAGKKVGEVDYYQQHVKAEFFADGVGWVPVDVSSGVVHDKTSERLTYFGNDRGNFLILHVDPEFVVDTVYFGKKNLALLQGVDYWVSGSGSLEKTVMRKEWQVEMTSSANAANN